jgi:hypothetical protein
MHTTTNKLILEPVLERPSAIIEAVPTATRWKNGNMSICGRVVAMGPKVKDVAIGEYAYHSDSCYVPVNEGQYNVIRVDDIMFLSKEPIPVQWLGAEEISYGG